MTLFLLILALAGLILLPGLAHARLFGAGPPGLERWILSIHLGIASWAVSCSMAYWAGNRLWVVVLIQTLLAVIAVTASRGRSWRMRTMPPSPSAIAVSLAAVLLLFAAPSDLRIHADDGAHLAQIRAVSENGQIFPAATFHPAGQVPGPDPRFGAAHALYGTLTWITRSEADQVWLTLRWILAPLLWLSFLLFARALVPGPQALLATLLALLFLGGIRFRPDWLPVYPLWLGMGATWVCLAAWLQRLRRKDPGKADIVVFGTLVLVHFFPWLAGAIGLGLLLLISGRIRPELWRPALLTLGVALVALCLRLLPGFGTENPLHRESWSLLDLGGGWVIFHPLAVLGALGIAGLAAGPVALLWRVPIGEDGLVDRVHRSWLLVPWLLVLNPLAVRLLEPGIGFLNYRLVLLTTTPILLAAWLMNRSRRVQLVAVLLVLLTLPLLLSRWENSSPTLVWDADLRRSYRTLAEQLPKDSCIAADPYTMLGLSAFVGVPVLAVPDGRSSPRDAQAVERLRLASRLYGVEIPRGRLEAFGITHVLYAPYWEKGLRGYRVMLPREQIRPAAPAWEAPAIELRNLPADWSLYPLGASSPSRSGESASRAASVVDRLLDSQTLPETLELGASLPISMRWQLAGSEGSEVPRLYLRLDHVEMSGGDGPFGKLVRKWAEKRRGWRERARIHFELEDSRNSREIQVEGEFKIPRDLKPGHYILKAQLLREDRSPNESLADLFRNLDRYSGMEVGRVELIP